MMNPGKYRDDSKVDLAQKGLDNDGIPFIGKKMEHGDAELCISDTVLGKPKYTSFKDHESARIETVRLMGDDKA